MITSYVQIAAALLLVICLIFGMGIVLRRKQNRFGLMSVVGYHSFGPKKGVAALKIGREVLILGVSTNDMRLLKTFRDDELNIPDSGMFQNRFEKYLKIGSGRNVN